MGVGRKDFFDLRIEAAGGRAIGEELAFKHEIALGRGGVLQGIINHQGVAGVEHAGEFVVEGGDLLAGAPACAVIHPGAALRVDFVGSTFVPHQPGKEAVAVDVEVVVAGAKLCTIGGSAKAVAACPGFDPVARGTGIEHFAHRTSLGIGQQGAVVVGARPEVFNLFHLAGRRSFDHHKAQIEELLVVARPEIHRVPQQGRIVGYVINPGSALGPEVEVDAIRRDEPQDFILHDVAEKTVVVAVANGVGGHKH